MPKRPRDEDKIWNNVGFLICYRGLVSNGRRLPPILKNVAEKAIFQAQVEHCAVIVRFTSGEAVFVEHTGSQVDYKLIHDVDTFLASWAPSSSCVSTLPLKSETTEESVRKAICEEVGHLKRLEYKLITQNCFFVVQAVVCVVLGFAEEGSFKTGKKMLRQRLLCEEDVRWLFQREILCLKHRDNMTNLDEVVQKLFTVFNGVVH